MRALSELTAAAVDAMDAGARRIFANLAALTIEKRPQRRSALENYVATACKDMDAAARANALEQLFRARLLAEEEQRLTYGF